MQQKKGKKRTALIAALAVLLVGLGVFGTVAWLTSQSELTNSFTVGKVNDPDNKPDPSDPDNPSEDPLEPEGGDKDKLDGNLYESKWEPGSKLYPSGTVDKNPNVGIGKESESSYVFLYVDSNTLKDDNAAYMPYFTLNSNWAAVNGSAAQSTAQGVSNAYVSGLFMYSGNGTDPSVLVGNEISDSWTGEAFSAVTVPAGTTAEMFADDPAIKVYSYVYAAEGTTAQDALTAAKAWAQNLAAGN